MTFRPIQLLAALALLAAPAAAAPSKPVKAAAAPVFTVESLLTDARAAMSRGAVELALRLAQSAIVADPARPTSYVALGNIHAAAGQPEYARNYYDAALEIDPQDPAALRAIAALGNAKPATTANAAP
jgi:tetratricopeptide (TPR) repeat protein